MMRRLFIAGLVICILAIRSFSQTITTSLVSGSTFCAGAAFNVSYSITGVFTGNVFSAQLSDPNGGFSSPTVIGTVTNDSPIQITITIPDDQVTGQHYRIRVVSSSPAIMGSDNGSDLVINEINLVAPTLIGTTFCPGASFLLNYSFVNSCNFLGGNIFTAQLSDASGSFVSPTILQSSTTNSAGSINVTIPTNTPPGVGYRLRLVSSAPSLASPDNGIDLSINAYGIDAPTISGTSFCQAESFTIGYTIQNGCSFPFLPSTNIFTAQLSNSTGSFTSPTNIGSVASVNAGFIQATIPGGTPAGTAYRIRVVSSNPSAIVGADNGTNIIVNSPSGNSTIFGTAAWNAYVYKGTATPIANNTFAGYYTETNLSFDTKNRWVTTAGPETADASSGSAYSGCPLAGTNYSVSFKRTNFACGYYQIDIPYQDDGATLFINGIQVFQNTSFTPNLQSNVWTGFLGPTSTVDLQLINFGGSGELQVTFSSAVSPLKVSPPVIVCSSSSTILTVSSSIPLTYAWTPTTNLTPSNGQGATVAASPSVNTTYTAVGADAVTGCSVSSNVAVTIASPLTKPSIQLTNLPSTICSGITTSTLTASGANTYTWSPTLGLIVSTGSTVTANPPQTTTYTVTGSTGCQSGTSTATVTVQATPVAPTTTFGNGTWNAYCYNNTTLSNYYGFYTEDNLSFNTTSRWANNSGPTIANSASGLAYSGCSFGSNSYSVSFKRTNFTCDYYQIDIPYQDDAVTLLVNGTQVFQNNNYTPSPQTNVWTGFLGPTTTVEIQFINYSLLGQMEISINPSSFVPQMLNTNSTICTGSSANLSATTLISGATFSWSVVDPSSTISFSPNTTVANPILQTTTSTPEMDYTVTNILTDATGSGCSTSKTFTVTVSSQANTTINPTNPTNELSACTNNGVTLNANGANTYTWSPSTGLSATTGYSVLATPLITTTYTVIGSNNCSTKSASTTVTVSPLPVATLFPTGTWNIYGFNSSTVGTNYQGYYTENGFGSTGLNFDTRTRWAGGDVPSNANASTGISWQGCAMNVGGTSLSFKRTGFLCGVYQLDVPSHQDGFLLLINGVQVAQHNGCCDSHISLWTGVLNSNSTVEWQLVRSGSVAYLQVAFTLMTQSSGQALWTGNTSNDWFDVTNWCNATPNSTTDVLIPSAGPQSMPVINGSGAVAQNVAINPSIPSGSFSNSIPSASLTTNSFDLNVFGNWTNHGKFIPNSGTLTFAGTGVSSSINSDSTETFNNLIINNPNGVTISSGIQQVNGSMTFTNGIVIQNSTLNILGNASVVDASDASYVDGPVTKIGNTSFTFPVGSAGLYRPITIASPSLSSDAYRAQYFSANPNTTFPIAQRASTLDQISNSEYWVLDRISGSSNVNVTLSWGSNSEAITDISLLRVTAWDGLLWSDQGNGGTTGTLSSGTIITTAPVSIFGPFTLDQNKVTTGIEIPIKARFSLYPNPAFASTSLDLQGAELNSILITNSLGQEVVCDYATGSTKVDINTLALSSGLYILNITLDQKPVRLKLIVQR